MQTKPKDGKFIIRTSDRGTFRTCRQLWDFTSKIRMNYEPTMTVHYFEFGTAIHNGLEVWYKPELWNVNRETIRTMAITSFIETTRRQMASQAKARPDGVLDEEKKQEYADRIDLGKGMIEHYTKWAERNDKFKPVYAEIEFEVPVVLPKNFNPDQIIPGFTWYWNEDVERHQLHRYDPDTRHYLPVVYQGRIDLIVEDEDGDYWIVDHKTAARFDSTEWVDKDTQVSSYCWAARLMGIPVQGFIMNQLRKAVPDKPKVLQSPRKGRLLSVSKSQATTYELFLEAIEEVGQDPELYEDVLNHFKAQGPEDFFRRIETHRTDTQIDYAGEMVFLEAIDMLGNPSIYPNPSQWNCRGCSFGPPCLARTEGSDWEFMLQNEAFFIKRDKPPVTDAPSKSTDTFIGG